jgi:hypothetical protein
VTSPEQDQNDQLAAGAEAAEREVRAIRFGGVINETSWDRLELPRTEDGPQWALQVLAEVRTRLDRVEELLATVTRLRALLSERSTRAENEVSDAWNAAVTSGGSRRSRAASFGESAPRERYAEADVAVLEPRRAARAISASLARVDAVRDTIRTAHWGIDKFRQDVHLVVRAMVVESSLER